MIRRATDEDLPALTALLAAEGMRVEGILVPGTAYWVVEENGAIIASLGFELGSRTVLLRSAIVAHSHRGRGWGERLTKVACDWAKQQGYSTVYCFSTDAGEYWRKRGFVACPVSEVVDAMPRAPQVLLFRELGWLPSEDAYKFAIVF